MKIGCEESSGEVARSEHRSGVGRRSVAAELHQRPNADGGVIKALKNIIARFLAAHLFHELWLLTIWLALQLATVGAFIYKIGIDTKTTNNAARPKLTQVIIGRLSTFIYAD
jgi:hypothetical protein